MTRARAIAAATVAALLAGAAEAQSELAPEGAVTPVERPEGAVAPITAPEPSDPPQLPEGAADEPPVPEPKPPGRAREEEPPPDDAPVPPEGPEEAEAPREAPVPDEPPQAPLEAPVPEDAPEAPATAPAPPEDPDAGAEAPAEAPAPAEPQVPEQLAEEDADLAACLGRLQALGTVFERLEPVTEEGGACGIVNPLRIDEVVPGVALEPPGVMRCAAAVALADWVAAFVLPASRLLPERGRLTALQNGSAYLCRGVGGGDELSQHAFGNAIDVMAFRFAEGDLIPVEPRERDGTPGAAFQRSARASACLLFTTVLGPSYNEAHDDHLHLDIEARQSGLRLCP